MFFSVYIWPETFEKILSVWIWKQVPFHGILVFGSIQ